MSGSDATTTEGTTPDAAQQESQSLSLEQLQQRIEDLQQQLLYSQKMSSLGELSSSVAHEFNNILTTVINYAKLGLRQKDAEERTKAFDKILSAGQRASKITRNMLSYARAHAQRREGHSLSALLQDVLVLVEKDLQVHRIALDLQILAEPYALVNAGQVQQVLLNLIVNARQAMEPGKTLTIVVSANAAEQLGEISIRDQGSGIPPEVLPHIFEKFYTTKSVDQNGQGGTGLGLSFCKDVMEEHGGRIRVETAVGHGTKITLRFPMIAPPNFGSELSSELQGGAPLTVPHDPTQQKQVTLASDATPH